MTPTSFKETNFVFGAAPGMENCDQLAVYKDENQVISCWKLSDADIVRILKTKKIWVFHAGNYLQPHALQTENPFEV